MARKITASMISLRMFFFKLLVVYPITGCHYGGSFREETVLDL
jgi:hypothetical protein